MKPPLGSEVVQEREDHRFRGNSAHTVDLNLMKFCQSTIFESTSDAQCPNLLLDRLLQDDLLWDKLIRDHLLYHSL
jgi:hypothetical protein